MKDSLFIVKDFRFSVGNVINSRCSPNTINLKVLSTPKREKRGYITILPVI